MERYEVVGIVFQLVAGLTAARLLAVQRETFAWLARVTRYASVSADSLLGATPLLISAACLAIGVMSAAADRLFGASPTGGQDVFWILFTISPLLVAWLVAALEAPVWLQPPGRWW